MQAKSYAVVVDRQGKRGIAEQASPGQDQASNQLAIAFEDGSLVYADVDQLARREDGTYYLDADVAALDHHAAGSDRVVLPVVEEEVQVTKRQVETGKVRIRKLVHERETVVEEPLMRDEVDVVRVPVNQIVEEPVPVRREGDTLIIPVLEEILVVQKRLLVKEELRVTRRAVQTQSAQPVTLRREEVIVEREAHGEQRS